LEANSSAEQSETANWPRNEQRASISNATLERTGKFLKQEAIVSIDKGRQTY
jgi:hypothetical protein